MRSPHRPGSLCSGGYALVITYSAIFQYLPSVLKEHRIVLANNRRAFEWITKSVPRGSTFFACPDPVLFLYTGHQACTMHIPPKLLIREDRDDVLKLLSRLGDFAREHRLGYLLETPQDFAEDLPEIEQAAIHRIIRENSIFQPIFRDAGTNVYRVRQK